MSGNAVLFSLVISRAANAVMISDSPTKHMLMPTRRPIAQPAELGQPSQIRKASSRSTRPLNNTHPQLGRCLRYSIAITIAAMPSRMKNTISAIVRVRTPAIGCNVEDKAEQNRQHRGRHRPDKARHLAMLQQRDHPQDAADEEQPADQDCRRQGGDVRQGDRQQAEDHHDDALGEKKLPMRMDRRRQLGAADRRDRKRLGWSSLFPMDRGVGWFETAPQSCWTLGATGIPEP